MMPDVETVYRLSDGAKFDAEIAVEGAVTRFIFDGTVIESRFPGPSGGCSRNKARYEYDNGVLAKCGYSVEPAPAPTPSDAVNHPKHYNSHPSGVECITVVEHMSFNVGNAMKYLWRADEKGAPIEDLRKAVWYIQREIAKREGE